MDVRFLKTISEAYIVQHRLQDKVTVNELFEDVYSLMKELRETDIELYDHLYDAPVLQQQNIISTYFDLQYQDKLEEIGTLFLAGAAISAILTWIYGTRITRTMFSFAEKFAKTMEGLAKFVLKKGRYWKFRYAIIEKNAKKCYVHCGVKDSDITSSHYFSPGADPGIIGSVKGREQARCLAKCYVEYTIESINLLCKSYFVCLKKTGDYESIQRLKPDDTLKVLSGLKLSNTCVDFYQEMRTLFDEFNDLLDYVYGKDESAKNEALKTLKGKLIESRNEISRSNNLKQYS
jgi:hypothetical protein